MARTTYEGYGLTELRRLASQFKLPGRSKMDGWALLTAVRAYYRARVVEQEQAVLSVVDVKPGVLLRHKSTGTTVRVTGELGPYVQDGVNYESLCFTAEYVEVGEKELDGNWKGRGVDKARYLNEENARTREWNKAGGYGDLGLRHMLYQYEAAQA